jgi:hypothetical protein
VPPLISTFHSSPQRQLIIFQPAVSSTAVSWQRLLTVEILQLPPLRSFLLRLSFRTVSQLFPQRNWIAISSQPPLHTSTTHNTQISLNHLLSWPRILVIQPRGGPHRKHHFQHFVYCCLRISLQREFVDPAVA